MTGPPQKQDAELFRAVVLPGVAASSVLLALYLATIAWSWPFPRDHADFAIGRDFLNFWMYGREAWNAEAGRFYDIWLYNARLVELTGWDYPVQQWSYLPHLMLLMAPFGLLPYPVAYAAWLMLGLAALLWAAPETFGRGRGALALALAPAGLLCLISGQNTFFTLAIVVAVFRFLDVRPILAGVLLGFLTVKPQLGLLFPVMLAMTGRWTTFASAALTAGALAGATALIWGADVWPVYFSVGVPLQEFVIRDPTAATLGLMPTAYMNARIIGLSPGIAYGVQALFGAAAVGAVLWTFWRRRDPLLSYALLLAAGLIATPYLMSYDLVLTVWAMIAVCGTSAPSSRVRPLLLVVLFLPFIAFAAAAAHIPGSALVLPVYAAWLLRELGRRGEAGAVDALHGGWNPAIAR
jgi:hypothetical protein